VLMEGVADVCGLTLTLADAFLLGSTTLVAVTVREVAAETVGAVRTPAPEIEPAEVAHVTPVLLVPEMLAKKDWDAPDVREAF
jgi:hypothetical protein